MKTKITHKTKEEIIFEIIKSRFIILKEGDIYYKSENIPVGIVVNKLWNSSNTKQYWDPSLPCVLDIVGISTNKN